MQKITDIKIQQKNQNKASIFVDGRYSFSLTIAQLAERITLKVGTDLSAEDLKEFKKLSNLTNHYLRLLNLILSRPRSEYEVITNLRQKKLDEDEIDQLVTRLKEEGQINDEKFASWWVESRKRSKPISRSKLRSELLQKRVKVDLEAIITDSFSSEEEFAILQDLAERKRSKYPTEEKLMAFLASKGFKYDQIKKALSSSESDF